MTRSEIEAELRAVKVNFQTRDPKKLSGELRQLKQEAVGRKDESAAKELWCLQQALSIQETYLAAYAKLRDHEFYEGWRTLEQVENQLSHLVQHATWPLRDFEIDFIQDAVTRFQAQFPYVWFISPEMLISEKTCSICKQVVSIRKPCHRVGDIYSGELCYRTVTKVEFLGTAMTKDPVQKYSVMFLPDPEKGGFKDTYNYTAVRYLIDRLQSPFDGWSFVKTKTRHPHSRYSDVGRNDRCPCESGKKYKKCCLSESGVLRPHIQFTFANPPPKELLHVEYA